MGKNFFTGGKTNAFYKRSSAKNADGAAVGAGASGAFSMGKTGFDAGSNAYVNPAFGSGAAGDAQASTSSGGYQQTNGGSYGSFDNSSAGYGESYGASGTGVSSGSYDYDAGGYSEGSFDDYYNRLISTLQSYGISMTLPTLEELYTQLTAFLRPSVDAAIAGRRHQGETAMAELDADAYSRGMGGSSYLSSMKEREYDDIARDVALLESKYTATLAEYLYNASNELKDIQAKFASMALQNAYDMQKLRAQQAHDERMRRLALSSAGTGRASGSTRGVGSGSGRASTGEGSASAYTQGGSNANYDSNYYSYVVYLNSLSDTDRHHVFTSGDSYWADIRNEMKRNLTSQQFRMLRATYDYLYGGGHGGYQPAPLD